jgi:hypothetical protein
MRPKKKPGEKLEHVSVYLVPELMKKVIELAKSEGRSTSGQIAVMIKRALETQKK